MRTIFTNAYLFDGTNAGVPGATIVVSGDRIESVGTSDAADVSAGDEVYDLAGRALLPGLGTGHFHGDAVFTDMANIENVYFGAERPAGVMMAAMVNSCRNLLESGHTMAIGAACAYDHDACVKLAVAEGLMDGPHLLACNQHVETTASENDRAKWWYRMRNTGLSCIVDGPDEVRRAIRQQVARGTDIIKLYPTGGHGLVQDNTRRYLTKDELRTAVDTAHDLGVKIRAHAAWKHMIQECIEYGVDIIDHGDEIDEPMIELMVEKGTSWCPSARLIEMILSFPSDDDGIDGEFKGGVETDWANLVRMVPIGNEAGVNIIPGDDYGIMPIMPHVPGIYAAEFVMYSEQMGIKPLDILRWATANVAKLFGREGELGTIAQNSMADLIVVDGDPPVDLSLLQDPAQNLPVVMKGGRFFKNTLKAHAPAVAAAR
jgi:imidazolonepropionase-like amidohydrolase